MSHADPLTPADVTLSGNIRHILGPDSEQWRQTDSRLMASITYHIHQLRSPMKI